MSTEYQPHLYMIVYPNCALVLSHLRPEDFGFRYNYGSSSFYSGKLIFAELDINYRNDYFAIDAALEKLRPHKDGSPKATKYVANYRILEHVDIDAVKVLYIANADGRSFPLYPAEYQDEDDSCDLKIFAEINPISMLTLSRYNMLQFGEYFTNPNNMLAVPRLLYAKIKLDIDRFLKEFEMNPFSTPPLEGVHPSKLRDAINELRRRKDKYLKGLTLDTAFTKESYRFIDHGFMLMDKDKSKFFPMPSFEEIEAKDLRFYRGM